MKTHKRSLPALKSKSGEILTQNNPNLRQWESFEHKIFGMVNVAQDADETPWFIAQHVADALGYSDTNAMTRHLDEDEVSYITMEFAPDNLTDANPMARKFTIVNESGLYSAAFRSRKPQAKNFKKWVTAEVLPAIRRTGRYEPQPLTREQRIARSLLDAQEVMEEQKAVIESQKKIIKTTGLRLLKTQHQIEVQKPEVDFARTVKRSEIEMGLTQGLKHIGVVKTNVFIKIMKTGEVDGITIPGLKMLESRGKKNYPMQKPLQKGLMTTKIVPIASGQAFPQTFFTAEGLEHMLNLIKKHEVLQQFC